MVTLESKKENVGGNEHDDLVRCLVVRVEQRVEDAGWAILTSEGQWQEGPKGNAKSHLMSHSFNTTDDILSDLLAKPWELVNLPFEDEYPGGRKWNRDGAQLAFTPADEGGEMVHPHWGAIFNHCGSGLDKAIADHAWCKEHGVRSGGDYLRLWASILLQHPTERLPYLFFFSEEQSTGKSSFHRALGLLFGRGYVKADSLLTGHSGFNREMSGAVLCSIEETDLSDTRQTACNRIKNWLDSDCISIHSKGLDQYTMRNTTHWIQCANDRKACPVLPGDKRIVVVEVPPLSGEEIPWIAKMKPSLKEEAPAFLRTLLDTSLPEPLHRLWLPVIDTAH